MIDINDSLFWQIGNFLLLMLLLNFVLYKPIRGILKKRAEKIAELNSDITSSQEGVKAKTEEMEARRAEARRAGAAVREDIKNQGRQVEREMIEAATKEMEEAVAKVREQIAADIAKARDELKGQVQTFGKELAQKVLGRTIQ